MNSLTVPDMVQHLRRGRPFAYSHYGPEEWAAIAAGDGVGEELRRTLTHFRPRPFYYALTAPERPVTGKITGTVAGWVDGDILGCAQAAGQLEPFVGILRAAARHMMYVCPERLANFAFDRLDCTWAWIVPERDAHLAREQALAALMRYRDTLDIDLMLFSCGMLAPLLIYDLWAATDGRVTLIDVGGLFDGYMGRSAADYERRLTR